MEIQFSASQPYQLAAISSVVALFEGQPQSEGASDLIVMNGVPDGLALSEHGLGNRLLLSPAQLLSNCQKVQAISGIAPSTELIASTLENGTVVGDFANFTVEMETGTGKTYVYLRTVYELSAVYGFKKFVIVVPSVAIREGVLKNLRITHSHLQELYDHEPCSFSVYDSARVNDLRSFALSNAIQILVINIDAFSKDSTEADGEALRRSKGNVINQLRETGVRPIEFIQNTNPVVIVDEPQNMETDLRKAAIARLNPLCTLRYSATPQNSYNLVYKLDPIQAYKLGLVKQIGVDSVVDGADPNQAYLSLEGFRSSKKSVSAKISLWVSEANGPVRKTVTVKNGADLYTLSKGREMYKDGFIVNEIDIGEEIIRFANDVTIKSGVPHGALTDAILKLQIEATVRRHFEKELRLRSLGVKVLSVLFIDRVSNYRSYSPSGSVVPGKFHLWFEEIYERYRARPEYADLYSFSASEAHAGYFSQDKQGHLKDSNERGNQEDNDTYALIMRDKERLLDPSVPLRFIFSHSALREGWDNPNVFQICTLAETRSEVKKRQEIGRGLRLAVNDKGARVTDPGLNRLTIIANESYEEFAQTLQQEMEQQGLTFDKSLIQDDRKMVAVQLKKGYEADPAFVELWDQIKQRTRYRVSYSTETLIASAIKAITKQPPIERPQIVISRAHLSITESGVQSLEVGRRTQEVTGAYVMPDLITQIQGKTSLSKSTVAAILLGSGRISDALKNPQLFIDYFASAINDAKRALLVDGVEYVRVEGHVYEMHRFKADEFKELVESNVVKVLDQKKTLFSHITIDSASGPEIAFAKACDADEDVHFYLKLPRWFVIETPIGPYTPDWALMYRDDATLYFVAETKDTGGDDVDLSLLRPLERLKIECGKKHFKEFETVRFRVVKTLKKLTTTK